MGHLTAEIRDARRTWDTRDIQDLQRIFPGFRRWIRYSVRLPVLPAGNLSMIFLCLCAENVSVPIKLSGPPFRCPVRHIGVASSRCHLPRAFHILPSQSGRIQAVRSSGRSFEKEIPGVSTGIPSCESMMDTLLPCTHLTPTHRHALAWSRPPAPVVYPPLRRES